MHSPIWPRLGLALVLLGLFQLVTAKSPNLSRDLAAAYGESREEIASSTQEAVVRINSAGHYADADEVMHGMLACRFDGRSYRHRLAAYAILRGHGMSHEGAVAEMRSGFDG